MIRPINEVIEKFVENLETARASISSSPSTRFSIPTGLPSLDEEIGGVKSGCITLIAADKLQGKTALALGIALNAALNEKHRTVIVGTQRNSAQIVLRLISQLSEIPIRAFKTGHFEEGDLSKLTPSLELLHDAQIFIKEAPVSIDTLIDDLVTMHNESPLGLVVIDVLNFEETQQSDVDARRERYQCLTKMKSFAIDHNLPVVVTTDLDMSLWGVDRQTRLPQWIDIPFELADMSEVVIIPFQPELYDIGKPLGRTSIAVLQHGADHPLITSAGYRPEIGKFYPRVIHHEYESKDLERGQIIYIE